VYTIREYQRDDLPTLKQLIAELHDTLRPFDEYLAPVERIADEYTAYLVGTCRDSAGIFLVAARGDRLVGFVCVFGLVAPAEPDQYPDKFSAIANIYVSPSLQGQGIGAALMQRAEDHARGLGVGKLELTVLSRNRRAVDFYRRLGYRERTRTLTKRLTASSQ
jgi:ribosomal protein S18 acetylase RimI-like enzyme